ncbi:MAG: cytochrome ubiquinol oxidase subunit I, partial [Phenylobacterium sp.]
AGFVAVISGWIVAEVGRQPWVIYGVLRTADAVSPVGPGQVSTSLVAFMVVYAVIFTAGLIDILRLMAVGPAELQGEAAAGPARPPGSAFGAVPDEPDDEGRP